jgi:hypothetical protein
LRGGAVVDAMSLQIERSLPAEIAWRLKALPLVVLPVPNGIWIPARSEAERSLVARIIARLKADGMLLPGAPDLVLMWADGCAAIELKRLKTRDLFGARPAGRPTDDQKWFAERCAELGVHHAYCTSWDELKAKLDKWGVGKPLPAPLASLSRAGQDGPPQPEPACLRPAARAVVADDGREIRLTLYAESGTVATVALDPVRAIRMAGELIEAALPKLRAP